MDGLRNRNHIKPVKIDDTETMYQLQNKSKFTRFQIFGNPDCLAFQSQTVAFKQPKF